MKNKYAPKKWKTGADVDTFDFETPSGELCLLKKINIEAVMRMGLINDLDYFSGSLISKKSRGKKKQDDGDFLDLFKDPEKGARLFSVVEAVVLEATILPKLSPRPEGDEPYQSDLIYVNQIDFFDKIAIFTRVFEGLGDMNKFRGDATDGVGDLEKSESIPPDALITSEDI